MINKSLFKNKYEMEIARLKWEIKKRDKIIEDFKAYDEERKKYYAEALNRLGEDESLLQELEDTDEVSRKLIIYKEEISRLNKKIEAEKIKSEMTDEEIDELRQFRKIKEQNERLRKDAENMRSTIKNLIMKNLQTNNK